MFEKCTPTSGAMHFWKRTAARAAWTFVQGFVMLTDGSGKRTRWICQSAGKSGTMTLTARSAAFPDGTTDA